MQRINNFIREHKGTIITSAILFVIILVILVLDCYDIPTQKWNIRSSLIINFKGIFYAALSLFFALIIFASQNINSTKHAILLNDAIERIKPFRTTEINKKIAEWLEKKEETRFILFYFPYSFIPGFWVNLHLFPDFQKNIVEIQQQDNLCIYLIGPANENINFKTFIQKVTEDIDNSYKKNEKNPLWKHIDMRRKCKENGNKKEELVIKVTEEIENIYSKKIQGFKDMVDTKSDYINYHIVNASENEYWEKKPKFSFILRMLKPSDKIKFEIIINDTFKLTDDFLLEIDYTKIDYKDVLKEPKSYYLTDENLSSLFISTILQSFKDDAALMAFIKSNKIIKNGNFTN